MRQRVLNISLALFATSLLLASGCSKMAYLQPTSTPMADLTASSDDYTGTFYGAGFSSVRPYDLSLDEAIVYDLYFAKDINERFRFETSLGYWDIPDKPVSNSDSSLLMLPILASLQVTISDIGLNRLYARAGAGYSINDYKLGSTDEARISAAYGLSYDAEVTSSPIAQLGIGWETYPENNKGTVITVEALLTHSPIEFTETYGSTQEASKDVSLNLLSFRLGLTF